MPQDLFDALVAATQRYGRPNPSDMARVILRRYLIEKPEEIGKAGILAEEHPGVKKHHQKQRRRSTTRLKIEQALRNSEAWKAPEYPINPFPYDL